MDEEKEISAMLFMKIIHETHKAFEEGNNSQFTFSHTEDQVVHVVVSRKKIDDENEEVHATWTEIDWDTAVFNGFMLLMYASIIADPEEMKTYMNELCDRFPEHAPEYMEDCKKFIEQIKSHPSE